MRWWILLGLAVVCIAAAMLIYVPSMEFQETAVLEAGPTAPPMDNITMADRDINLNFVSPLGDADADAGGAEAPAEESLVLTFDAKLTEGIADVFPTENGLPVLIDLRTGRWNEALSIRAIDRPEIGLPDAEVAQTLRLETGILALGAQSPSFLHLYSDEGEQLLDLTVPSLSADLSVMPMANPDCAYIAKVGTSTVFDTKTGDVSGVSAPGRPVWLDRDGGTLTMERGGDYIVRALVGGEEQVYRLVY